MAGEQQPPHNTDAERGVLGSIMLDTVTRSGDRVMDLALSSGLTAESFFDPRNAEIFATMRSMNLHSKPLDAITLLEELNVTGKLPSVGGAEYVDGLMEATPTTAHAEHYIRMVLEKQLRRTMIDRATKVIRECYDENEFPDPRAVLGSAEKSFLEIGLTDQKTMSWDKAIKFSADRIDSLFESNGDIMEGLSTGLKHLDEKLLGLKNSEMIVIAARPSVGKTSLAMNIAESCATGLNMMGFPVKHDGGRKHPVMIFSLEMPVESLTKRMIAGKAQIDTWRLNRNLIPSGEKAQLSENLGRAVDILAKAPIYVDDTAGLDVMDLRARARRAKKQWGIELIVIDYLQLCTCREAARQGSRQIEVSMISQQIKAMAKELKIPVIVLSQLSRANEQRGDKYEKPKLSDLRDSGAIEQDADVVFLLRRPSRNSQDPESKDEALAIIDVAKNRNGETGEVRVNFYRQFTRFMDREIEREGSEQTNEEAPLTQTEQGQFVSDDMSF